MTDFEPRLVNFRAMAMAVMAGALIFLFISLIGVLAGGSGQWGLAFIISIPTAIIGIAFYGLTRVLLAVEADAFHTQETLERLLRHHDQLVEGVRTLNEGVLVSEDAKAVAFRDKNRLTLRQAITEEITAQNWEMAIYLADQMENRFGLKQEADQVRRQVDDLRRAQRKNELAMAMAKFDDAVNTFDWEAAGREMEAIVANFPEAPEAKGLQDRLDEAKRARKKALLQEWDQAVQRNEVDRGIEILKVLERYLTASEMAAFEESAREVFRTKLHNLGVQFSLLVTEKVWDRALAVGEEIVGEFPNSRMAQEIRDGLANLKAKAHAMAKG